MPFTLVLQKKELETVSVLKVYEPGLRITAPAMCSVCNALGVATQPEVVLSQGEHWI